MRLKKLTTFPSFQIFRAPPCLFSQSLMGNYDVSSLSVATVSISGIKICVHASNAHSTQYFIRFYSEIFFYRLNGEISAHTVIPRITINNENMAARWKFKLRNENHIQTSYGDIA